MLLPVFYGEVYGDMKLKTRAFPHKNYPQHGLVV